MAEEPAKFLAIAANVLPKDVNVNHEATDGSNRPKRSSSLVRAAPPPNDGKASRRF
jgi:hypothetical protein